MKTRILLLVCTFLLTVAGAQAQSPDQQRESSGWKLYTVKDEQFSFSLPNHPSMQTTKEKPEQFGKARRRRILASTVSGVVYTIHSVDNPKQQQSLDAFIQEQTTSNPTWDLASPRNLELDGITGKAFVSSDGRGMVQFFATDDRLYEFRAYGVPLDDTRMTRFFSSLSLKRKDGSVEVFDGPGTVFDSDIGDVYKGSDVDSKVVLKSKPPPNYDASQGSGIVVLRCIFSSKGTVTHIFVIKGLPGGLTESAIEAARKIKFTPAMKDGRPVSMWMQLEYNFNFYND